MTQGVEAQIWRNSSKAKKKFVSWAESIGQAEVTSNVILGGRKAIGRKRQMK